MTLPIAPATSGKSQRSSSFFIDVNTTPDSTATWLRLFGIKSFAPDSSVTLQENTDWDDVDPVTGITHQSQIPVSDAWTAEITFSNKDYGTATYQQDPGQAYLEENNGGRVEVRYYRRNGAGKVNQGHAYVAYKETDNSGILNASATLTGDGGLDKSVDASTIVTP